MKSFLFSLIMIIPFTSAARIPDLVLSGQANPDDLNSWIFHIIQMEEAIPTVTCEEVGNPYERHRIYGGASLEQNIALHGLKAASRYQCFASSSSKSSDLLSGNRSNTIRFTTGELPQDLPVPLITTPTTHPEDVAYTVYNVGSMTYDGDVDDGFDKSKIQTDENFLVLIDAEGNVRWYLRGPGAGDLDVTYIGDDQFLFGGTSAPIYPPTMVNLQKQMTYYGSLELTDPFELAGSYHHDVGLSATYDSIFAMVESQDPNTGMKGFVIQELSFANDVVWSWSSNDAVRNGQLSEVGSILSDDPLDPFHANALVDRIEDDDRHYLYVSTRNRSNIYKMDYETGEIVWTLGYDGDFPLLDLDGAPAAHPRWFFNQHDVRVDGNRITMFDNGFDRDDAGGVAYSRVLEIELDESRMIARIVYEYAPDGWLEPFWGGFDHTDRSNRIITKGHCEFCETEVNGSSLIREIDASNKTVWEAVFEDPTHMIYRSDRVEGCDLFNNLYYCPARGAIRRAPVAPPELPSATRAPSIHNSRPARLSRQAAAGK